jgi:hypothetical protein
MATQCTLNQLEFQGCGKRAVVADFDGGHISSDGGVLLLRETDRRLDVTRRFAQCFTDHRRPDAIEHRVDDLVRQRVYALALGYEDVNDHDTLRQDPLLALAAGKQDVEGRTRRRRQDRGKALAGKSTLNRLEQAASPTHRYWKIAHDGAAIEEVFMTVFLESYKQAPREIILDFDATDDPLYGQQEGRFFHGYYRNYCYLPLYVFCGEHLLLSRLRTSNRDASDGAEEALVWLVERIRRRWPHTRIIVRADSGFAREGLFSRCEELGIFYVIGLAKNSRLIAEIELELAQAEAGCRQSGQAHRVFKTFRYQTRDSWTRERQVIAKAEHLPLGANPRFIVTNLPETYATSRDLYEKTYCARGDMENRIKEQQLDLFADRTSATAFRANQLRLWLSGLAYVLIAAVRRIALKRTRLARASCGSIRLWLLKIGALVRVSVRRVRIQLASTCPYQDVFRAACARIQRRPLRC